MFVASSQHKRLIVAAREICVNWEAVALGYTDTGEVEIAIREGGAKPDSRPVARDMHDTQAGVFIHEHNHSAAIIGS